MRAKLALQRRAYQRGLVEKTDQQLATLQELVTTIEFAQLEQSIVYGLEQGNQVLKEIHKELSLDRVDDLMNRTADAQYYQRVRDFHSLRKSTSVLHHSSLQRNKTKSKANCKHWLPKQNLQQLQHLLNPYLQCLQRPLISLLLNRPYREVALSRLRKRQQIY